jgi:hypothetical protein
VYIKNAFLVSRRKYLTKERFETEAPCFAISEVLGSIAVGVVFQWLLWLM